MVSHEQACIHNKCLQTIKLIHVNLNHFPRQEKYGLCQEIRQTMYSVLSGIVECRKKYHNKTSLSRLDTSHEVLRTLLNLAFELGYFDYKNHKSEGNESEALRKYTAVSILVNELGAMIGGWIKSARSESQT
jgi:four helix bundle protein